VSWSAPGGINQKKNDIDPDDSLVGGGEAGEQFKVGMAGLGGIRRGRKQVQSLQGRRARFSASESLI